MVDDFWERAALRDPLWAILSDPAKRDRQWDLGSFFESGRREVSLLEYQLRRLGHQPRAGRALDFGCGVGRLTQALAASFQEVIGVDASPTMIRLAERLNQNPNKVRYLLNTAPVLEAVESNSIDLLYTDIVLQHLEPALAIRYVADFLRVLAPRGIAVFQLPARKRAPSQMPDRPVSMRDDAYRADLRIVRGMSFSMTAGERRTVTIAVRNLSAVPWDQDVANRIRLGNHWRSLAGDMLVQDDGREPLPTGLIDTQELSITITAPADPGQYICEFDLVHEGIAWFRDRGSESARARITVTTSGDYVGAAPAGPSTGARPEGFPDIYALLPPPDGEPIDVFPMFGISRAIVEELIRTAGGQLFHVDKDERAGPEWESYIYFVKKIGADDQT